MTGRGRSIKYFHRPSSNPEASIGLKLSAASPKLEAESDTPYYLVVTARILNSPHPRKSVTLATQWNPLQGWLGNFSLSGIKCIHPEASVEKRKYIGTGRPGCTASTRDRWKDWRKLYDFVTLHPNEELHVKYEVPRENIRAAGVQKGEKYRVELTRSGLGTYWWMYGSLDDYPGFKFRKWERGGWRDWEEDEYMDSDSDDDEQGDCPGWTMGEDPSLLGMEIEEGVVEFEVI
ncbi:hypothetical protein BDV96DRAFT_687726 [Lophiotrema nucula]|uniref:Uncharacterized protein n=1 Tax=Lophiotrema nucula TaxID=690887 RepID=A0A6A5Z6N7_9PLEO|nr:hypothetical protein BDV96DRAFT_687726 [Lophiotrema nucula]